MSRTYAVLQLSKRAFTEIARKLRDAGYSDSFKQDSKHPMLIDMHGLAVVPPEPEGDIEEAQSILWAKSMYGSNTERGMVELEIHGNEITCSPVEARAFAYAILEAAEAAETDEFIMNWLDNSIGVTDKNQRGAILLEFRKQREEMRKR